MHSGCLQKLRDRKQYRSCCPFAQIHVNIHRRELCTRKNNIEAVAPCVQTHVKMHRRFAPKSSASAKNVSKLLPHMCKHTYKCIKASPLDAPRPQKNISRGSSVTVKNTSKLLPSMLCTRKNALERPPHVCKDTSKRIEAAPPEAPRLQKLNRIYSPGGGLRDRKKKGSKLLPHMLCDCKECIKETAPFVQRHAKMHQSHSPGCPTYAKNA